MLRTAHYREAVIFFKEVLNFRSSDEVEGWITFLRCFPNPLHHSIGIASAARNMLHHVSFLVRSLDDVHAAEKRFREGGVPIMCGPGRHPPSGSAFIYFLDPDGLTLDHICLNRACLNLRHLDLVTQSVNSKRRHGIGR